MKQGWSLGSVLFNLFQTGTISLSSILFSNILLWKIANAQPIIPEPNGTNTLIHSVNNQINITGGTPSSNGSNLFHSFTEFNVNSDQTAHFISHPGIENILTRVVGGNPSVINGLIQMTGGHSNLFLMNPAGVIFGSQARLNLPTALTITTATGIGFNQGWFNAMGSNNYGSLLGTPNGFQFALDQPGLIINAGELKLNPGQDLTLLGGTVINTGKLVTKGGNITLASIEGTGIVRLSQTGHLLNLEIQSATLNSTGNPIALTPLSLPQLLTGKSDLPPLGVARLADGTVQLTASATPIPTTAGTTIISGSVDVTQTAENQPLAGQVNIVGQTIGLVNTDINASGLNGGGTIRVGGDYRGGSALPTANRTMINPNSDLIADAIQTGNGGEIILWSQDFTQFSGHISAQSSNGMGGFAEISSKGNLIVDGTVNLTGVNGSLGTLLLDPRNITIVDANDPVETQDPLNDGQLLVGESSNNYTLSERTLESLGETAEVILEAENNIEIKDLGDNLLNLQATTGSVTFTADADGDGSGSFSMNSEDTIQTNGGSLTINGVGIRTGNLVTQGGEITLQSTGNGNIITTDLSSRNLSNQGGNIILSTEQGSIRTGNLTTEGLIESGNIQIESGDQIQLGELSTQANDSRLSQGGNVVVAAINDITIDQINTQGRSQGGEVSISSQQGNITFAIRPLLSIDSHADNGNGGDIEIVTSERLNIGSIEARGQETGGNIHLEAEVELTTEDIMTGSLDPSTSTTASDSGDPHSNINLTSDEINLTGNLTGSGNLLLQPATDAQNIAIGGVDDNSTVTQNLTGDELAQIQDGFTQITIGRLETKGTLTIAGDVTFRDPVLLRSPLGQIITPDPSHTLTGLDDASLTLEARNQITVGDLTTETAEISLTSQLGDITARMIESGRDSEAVATLRLTGREINLTGGVNSIQGRGELILQPASNSQAIRLGGNLETDALDLTTAELNAIADGFELITIGRPQSNATISWVEELTFSDPILLQVPAGNGSILSNGRLRGVDNASITLNAAAEIQLDQIVTQGSDLKITSTTGSVSTRDLLGSERVEINGNDNINTGNITANQQVLLNSSEGEVLTGNLQTLSNQAFNPGVRLNAFGNITTQDIQTTVPTTDGGNISLNSEAGAIQTGNLNSSSLTQGGNITLQARTQIQTGEITANSQTQQGGEVQLLSSGDIEVFSIQAEGQEQGGKVEIITDQLLRVTGQFTASNEQEASLSVLGNEGAGEVNIQQGGDSANTPFVIGDATVNGTAAAIVEGVSSNPVSTVGNQNSEASNPPPMPSLPETDEAVNQNLNPDTTQNNVTVSGEVINPEIGTEIPNEPVLNTEIDNPSSTEVSNTVIEGTESITLPEESQELVVQVEPQTIASDQIYQSPFMSSVLQIDASRRQEFLSYLGNNSHKNLTREQSIHQTLSNITKLTGYKPAVVYISAQKNQLELRLLLPNGQSIFKRTVVDRKELLEIAQTFTNQIRSPRSLKSTAYLQTGQQLYNWLILPLESELVTQGIRTLVFSMDAGLRTLPIAALHDGEQFLLEKYSLGLIPSLSLTDTSYVNLQQAQVLAMGAAKFSDTTQHPLPAVPLELNLIVDENRWPGQLFLNEEFTVENLKTQRYQQQYEIIHLATHGEFLAGGAEQSYIQFWDRKLGLDELRSLKLNQPPVELLVLSACTTAVGDEKAELGFAGLAVQAGVKSALASLWYVSDAGTLGLMTTFYQELLNSPIKAEALRQAQLAMLNHQVRLDNGQLLSPSPDSARIELPPEIAQRGDVDLSHPFYWAGFTMIGSPW